MKEIVREFLCYGLWGNTYIIVDQATKHSKFLLTKAVNEEPEWLASCVKEAKNISPYHSMLGLAYLSLAKNKELFRNTFNETVQNIVDLYTFCVLMEELELSSNMVKKTINNWYVSNLEEKDASIHKMIVRDCVDFSGVKISKKHKKARDIINEALHDEIMLERTKAVMSINSWLSKNEYEERCKILMRDFEVELGELHSLYKLDEDKKIDLVYDYLENQCPTRAVIQVPIIINVFDGKLPVRIQEILKEKIVAYTRGPWSLLLLGNRIRIKSLQATIKKKIDSTSFLIPTDKRVGIYVNTAWSMSSPLKRHEDTSTLDMASLIASCLFRGIEKSKIYSVGKTIKEIKTKAKNISNIQKRIKQMCVSTTGMPESICKSKGLKEDVLIYITHSQDTSNLEYLWSKERKDKNSVLVIWRIETNKELISRRENIYYIHGFGDHQWKAMEYILTKKEG